MTPARVSMKKPATVRNQSCHCAPCHAHEKKACYGCQTCWNSSTSTPGRPRLAGVMAVVPQLPLGAVASPGPPRALPARPSPCVCPHIAGAAIRPGAIKGWLFAPELSVVGLGASLAFPSKRSRQRRCVGPSSSPSSSSGHAVAVYALTADAGRRRTRRGWRGARDLGRTGSSPRAAASEPPPPPPFPSPSPPPPSPPPPSPPPPSPPPSPPPPSPPPPSPPPPSPSPPPPSPSSPPPDDRLRDVRQRLLAV